MTNEQKKQLPNLPELPANFRMDTNKIEKSFDDIVAKKTIGIPYKTPVVSKNNIYKAAWDKVFNSYPEWRRNEIKRFIQSGELDNRFYTDFVQSVITTAELMVK